MFYDLQHIAEDFLNGKIELQPGHIPLLCWERYCERIKKEKPVYNIRYVDIECLFDQRVIDVIKSEIKYLNELK
jgi:hypothetical protein